VGLRSVTYNQPSYNGISRWLIVAFVGDCATGTRRLNSTVAVYVNTSTDGAAAAAAAAASRDANVQRRFLPAGGHK
jgi:predicted porin